MPSLSALFKKRRSLQGAPSNDTHHRANKSPREPARRTHGDGATSYRPPRGVVELVDWRADSGDEQASASPTVATGPWRRHSQQQQQHHQHHQHQHQHQQQPQPRAGAGAGRLTRYVSAHDPFRRFRSRSTQFRLSGGVGGGPSDVDEEARVTSWAARKSVSDAPDVAGERVRGGAQVDTRAQAPETEQQQQRSIDEWPSRVTARDASLAALDQTRASARGPAQDKDVLQQTEDDHRRPRPSSDIGPRMIDKAAAAVPADPSMSFANNGENDTKLQKLKKLPSLSLRRGFSRRTKTLDTPVSQSD
ncbi:unnamed protein product [Discula destructiva]